MSQDTLAHEETLAKAAVVFCQKAYATFPEVRLYCARLKMRLLPVSNALKNNVFRAL